MKDKIMYVFKKHLTKKKCKETDNVIAVIPVSVLKKRDIKFMINLNRVIKDNEKYLGYRVKQIIGEHLEVLEGSDEV